MIRDENPIIPLYFYVGFSYFNTNSIKGIYPNILDSHPLNAISKVKVESKSKAGGNSREAAIH
ncbi:hypothetical protein [Pedosphaera parvula]|uniref:hypothetical protein n=1 Tax=Pedosphaera parvula TaxID=1032527 RepID=UPI0003197B20|nr:hypothetical protein [Pedosphaera parvula]